MKKESSKKSQILSVCVGLLKEKPIDEISIRSIAEKAGCNLASINYYFNSKETLFNEAVDLAMQQEIETWSERNLDFKNIGREDIRNVLLHFHLAAFRYPSLARTRIIDLLNASKPNRANMMIYDLIFNMARAVMPEIDPEEIRVRTSLAVAAVWYVSCGRLELNAFLREPIDNDESLQRYTDKIFEVLFKK
ncbi:MAG: TetR/AcrR family transcriptional regulator [Chloroflexota bacterium]